MFVGKIVMGFVVFFICKIEVKMDGSLKCLKYLREIIVKDFIWGKVGEFKEKKVKEFFRVLLVLGRIFFDF